MLAPRLSQDNTKSRRVFIALAMKLIGHIHDRRPRLQSRTPPLRPTRMEPGLIGARKHRGSASGKPKARWNIELAHDFVANRLGG